MTLVLGDNIPKMCNTEVICIQQDRWLKEKEIKEVGIMLSLNDKVPNLENCIR